MDDCLLLVDVLTDAGNLPIQFVQFTRDHGSDSMRLAGAEFLREDAASSNHVAASFLAAFSSFTKLEPNWAINRRARFLDRPYLRTRYSALSHMEIITQPFIRLAASSSLARLLPTRFTNSRACSRVIPY